MVELESGRNVSDADAHLNLSISSTDDFPSQSDALLPVQFFDSHHSTAQRHPLRRLMFAILTDAVRCFQTNLQAQQQSKRREFAETDFWLFSASPDGPFTFETVCDVLEIEPGRFRCALSEWRDRKLAGEAVPTVSRHSPVVIAKRVSANSAQSQHTSHRQHRAQDAAPSRSRRSV